MEMESEVWNASEPKVSLRFNLFLLHVIGSSQIFGRNVNNVRNQSFFLQIRSEMFPGAVDSVPKLYLVLANSTLTQMLGRRVAYVGVPQYQWCTKGQGLQRKSACF